MRIYDLKPEKDKIYLISPYGIGDTILLCGMRRELEDVYHCPIVYIIKPSHEIVMDMFHIQLYIVGEFTREELLYIGESSSVLQKGKLFAAHPDFHPDSELFSDFLSLKISFIEMYKYMLHLPADCVPDFPETYFGLDKSLQKKIGKADIENIVLVAPEMNASGPDTVRMEYFEKRIEDLLSKNEKVVLNVTGNYLKKYDCLKMSFTLRELAALSVCCKKIISSRSGFCDLIFRQAGERLEIIYPNLYFWKLYNLKTMFPKIEMKTKETVLSFGRKLRERGYKDCAIYGMGVIGQHILKNLQWDGFCVRYAIDRNAGSMEFSMPIFFPVEEMPETDVVIVTPKADFFEICSLLKKKIRGDVIHYSELL